MSKSNRNTPTMARTASVKRKVLLDNLRKSDYDARINQSSDRSN